MSTTPGPPLLSDRLLSIIAYLEGNVSEWVIDDLLAIHDELEIYEAARDKDAELIQTLLDALVCTHEDRALVVMAAKNSALAAGFKPSKS